MRRGEPATSHWQELLALVRRWADDEGCGDCLSVDEASSWLRLTLVAVRDGTEWRVAAVHLSPSPRTTIATARLEAG